MLEGNLIGFTKNREIIMPVSVNVIKDGKFSFAGAVDDPEAYNPPGN